ncbi:MAG: SLC13 family permease [bacterium]
MDFVTGHTYFSLGITGIALFLFSRRDIPLATSSLLILVSLTLAFAVFPHPNVEPVDFYSGFGHQALITIICLMIMGQGLVRTAALEPLGRVLARVWRSFPYPAMLLTLVCGALLSAFVNNTPIVVLLLPLLISVSMRANVNSSRILMPMGFATLLGGMCTTIGTSTNLLIVNVAADLGLPKIGIFDFVVPAMAAGLLGILYLWIIAPMILPDRQPVLIDTSPRVFAAQLLIPADSSFVERPLFELINKTDGRMEVSQIQRASGGFVMPLPDSTIRANDRLIVSDTPERLKEYEELLDGTLYSENVPIDEDNPLSADDQQLAEIIVTPGSGLQRKTLHELRFLHLFSASVLAIHRAGKKIESVRKELNDIPLRSGDVLLVQGSRDHFEQVKADGRFLLLDAKMDLPLSNRAVLAILILVTVVALAALDILPISISALTGVLMMLLTRCLNWRDVGRAVNEHVVLIIVVSLALAAALEKTQGAEFLAQSFLSVTRDWSPQWVIAGLLLMMGILTNVVSNNAAAVIGTPIAVSIALDLGQPIEPFVLAVLFGSNLSFVTPMAYQTNLLVMNAGGYHFSDFVRVGLPLAVLIWGLMTWLLPVLYPLN